MIKKGFGSFLFVLYALVFLSSCLTQGVKKVSGTVSDLETVQVLKLNDADYGTIYVSGILSSNDAGSESKFEILSLYWFNNWVEGWTEVRFSASGTLDISINGKSADAFIAVPIEIVAVEDVKIRYRDTIIEHDAAVRQFQGRSDRIAAAVEILKENGSLFWSSEAEIKYPRYSIKGSLKEKGFVNAVQQLFFPELFGYVSPYVQSEKEEFIRADEYSWDAGYTKKVFPEHFHEVRNSGTIYRDWIESKRYFYFLYRYDEVFGKEAVGKQLHFELKN